jgi:hypothetical protein
MMCGKYSFLFMLTVTRSRNNIFTTIWLVQHGINLIQKEVSSLEDVRFLFDFKHRNNPQSLFRDELSTSNNFQVLSTYTLNVIRSTYANNWPTSIMVIR